MAAQHKATLRRSLRSALKHRRGADELLDGIKTTVDAWNAAMDKLDADAAGSLDTDYVSTTGITTLFEADDVDLPAQHKATLRRVLISSLSHRRLGNELADALEELQVMHNALMTKLDAEAGTLASTDFESTLAVEVTDAEEQVGGAQHKASLRRSLISALSHRRLANQIMDAITGLQTAANGALAQIDTGTINGQMAQFKVDAVDPDQA